MARKTVHFNDKIDADIISHAESFGNFSAYVKKLIRNDMKGTHKPKGKREKEVTKKAPPIEEAKPVNDTVVEKVKPSIYEIAAKKASQPPAPPSFINPNIKRK